MPKFTTAKEIIEGAMPPVKVGDIIVAYGNKRVAELTGELVSIGRVNLKLKCVFRMRPDGPWFTQFHKVPKHEVTAIGRNGEIIYKKPKQYRDF